MNVQLTLAPLLVMAVSVFAQESPTRQRCPVMPDREIGEDAVVVVWQGREISLCCKRCRAKFLAEPERYLSVLESGSGPGSGGLKNRPPLPSASDHPPVRRKVEQQEVASGHDHSHHEEMAPSGLQALGRLHPMVVHFPIALLLVAIAVEAAALFRRRPLYGPTARVLVSVGALSGALAAGLGWLLAGTSEQPGTLEAVFVRHRFLGIAAAAAALVALIAGEWDRRHAHRSLRIAYLTGLLLAAVAVAGAGHQGGTLVYGPGWVPFLPG